MLKYYLLTAWRHVARQKLFALINVLGLAIGLTVFILIFLYVKKEYSWDRHWENADSIYWLTRTLHFNETTSFKGPNLQYPMTSLIRANFPDEIDVSARVVYRGDGIVVGQEQFLRNITLADRTILDIFDFEEVSGSLADTMAVPGRIAIRQEDVALYFGSADPLGKTLTLQVSGQDVLYDYLVSAVFNLPDETSARLDSLSLLQESAMPEWAGEFDNWQGRVRTASFFRLPENADVAVMNRRLADLVDTSMPKEPWRVLQPGERMSDFNDYAFEPLADAHFDDALRVNNSGDRDKVNIFGLIGVVVLVMGSTNFVILATARSDDRKREVGVRKVLGANKQQLVVQYLGESLCYTLVAMILAIGMVALTLQYFSSLLDQALSFDLFDSASLLALLLLVMCVGVLGGLYPATVLASFGVAGAFNPAGSRIARGAVSVRGLLACFQFAIAIALIIATLVLYFQLNFIRGLDLGFETENILVLEIDDQTTRENVAPLINELGSIPGVEAIAGSSLRPVKAGAGTVSVSSLRREQNQAVADFEGFWVDYGFFDLYGLELLAGRTYEPDQDLPPDRESPGEDGDESAGSRVGKMVVNRQMTESLGFESPEQAIGEVVFQENPNTEGEVVRSFAQIIGVVENSKYRSLRAAPMPEVYHLNGDRTTIVSVKYLESAENNLMENAETAWNSVFPDRIFMGDYLEQSLIEAYTREQNEGRLLLTFSGLAIFIAALGLFGIAAYAVKNGVKEIGIRKVLGATSRQVLLLFLWRFSLPILVANLIAWPTAVYIMLRWLQRFNEQIDYWLLIPICLFATLLALVIAWATVSLTTVRAARANPMESLRYE